MSARGDAAQRGTDDGDAAGGPAFQSVGPVPEHTHQAGDKRPAGDELFNNYPPSQRRSDPPYSNERSHRKNSTGRARNPRLSPYANANRPRARKREPGQRYRSASPATHLPPSIRPRTPPAPERPTSPTVYPIQLAPIVNPNIRPDSPLGISTMWTYEEALPPSASGILHYPPAPAPPAIPPRPATRAESNMNTVETESRDTFNPPPTASTLSFCQDPNCDQVHMGDPCTDPSCTDNHDRVPGPVHSQPNGHQSHTSPYPRPSSAAPYPHQAPTHPSQAQPYPPQVSPYPPQRRSYPAQRAPYPPHPQAQAQGSQPPVYGPQSAYPPPQQMYPPGAGHYPVHPSHNPNFPHSAPPTTQHRGSMMHAQPPPLGLPGNNVGEAPNRRGGSRMGRARNQSSTPDAHHQPQPGPSYGASVPVCLACWVTRFPGPNVLFERLYTSTEWGDRNVFCSQCGDKGRWKTNYP